jgi:hypothetical protein
VAAPDWVQYCIPFAQAFGPAIGWGLVIWGWKIVSKDNNSRERRKEVRALINEARSITLNIERCAYAYYQKEHKDSFELSMEIKRELQHLAKMLASIKRINTGLDFDAPLLAFRQKVTSHDFDDSRRIPRNHSDRLYLEISTAALDLIDSFEDKFGAAYP